MLQARSSDGRFIILANLKRSEIEFHRKKTNFFCPTCGKPVMIKSGSQMIPHFAHYSKSNCTSTRGGEGPYHEKGKLLLYQWLKQQNLQVFLEKYIPEINQQPDIFMIINQKRIAIEFQCARTNIREIKKRNKGYKTAGIHPIWILGANLFQRESSNYLKIDQLTLQFVHQFASTDPTKIYYFCPDTLQLVVFEDMYMTRAKKAIGKLSFYKLPQLRFLQLFKNHLFPKIKLYELWKLEKRQFRLNYQRQLYGQERAWQQWIYLQNTHIQYLPSIIHLPISSQLMMKSPTWNWQSRLCILILCRKDVGSHFTMKECISAIQNHLHQQSNFPLIHSFQHPIKQYLNLLVQLKYIQQISVDTYVITKKIKFHNHIEQSLKADNHLMNQLILQN